ncbi:MAG: bacteriohemerythrin [Bryobacteraceae bacterium]
MPVQWESRFETGETRVDDQHRRLFEYVNKLEELIQNGFKPHEFDNIVSFLSLYVRVHFVCEESCMSIRHCIVAEKNKAAHQKFLDFFEKFKMDYERRGADKMMVQDLYNAASQWLVNHICRIDVQLREAEGNPVT